MNLIEITNGTLSAVISTRGAELQSLKDASGRERLWQGDPAFWTGRAPILFPVCGGLRNDCYVLDGVRYEMPKHGIVRKAEWTAESAEKDRAVFLITETAPGFPFRYELRAVFALEEDRLVITYEVKNLDGRTFWFTLGSHEAFATPGGVEDWKVVFDEPETLAQSRLIGNLIEHGYVILGENVKELPMKTEYFAVDAMVFTALKSRGVTLCSDKHEGAIRVDYPGMDTLMLWQKPGAEYLCIEPWCKSPDYVDADEDVTKKPGMIPLAPGEVKARTHTVTVI